MFIKKTGTKVLSAMVLCAFSAGAYASPAAPTNNPFSGNGVGYEALLNQTKQAQAEQKLAQARYEIARYKARLAGLERASAASAQTGNAQTKAIEARLATLDTKVNALIAKSEKTPSIHAPTSASVLSPISVSAPQLLGVANTAAGRVAWIQVGHRIQRVRDGGTVAGWTVRSLTDSGVNVVDAHHRSMRLRVKSAWTGTLDVSGKVNVQQSGNGYIPPAPAPGSTPASAQSMQQQGAMTIANALSGSLTSGGGQR